MTIRPMAASDSRRVAKSPVDWASVRARLEHATGPAGPANEDRAAILARRAQELARPGPAAEVPAADRLDVVAFELEGQTYAFDAMHVRETVILRELTRLPGLPETVRGAVNVRSRVLAAVDLRPLLQLAPAAATQDEKLLIVECEGSEFGVVTDRVVGLRPLSKLLRREVPGLNDKYLRGLADEGIVVLSLPALLPDLVVDDRPES